MEIGSKRKSPRALTQISGAISDAKAEYKCKRKELATALKAEIKSEFQEQLIAENPRLVKILTRQWETQKCNQSRLTEMYDTAEELAPKVAKLIEMIRDAEHPIVYTGAGISTSANIPDYRGTGGVYSSLASGQDIKQCNLVTATPTLGHMALSGLLKSGIFKFLLSQNCDGLHLRSGVSPEQLSEIHGNMFMENCDEGHFFYRTFDVTEKTNVKRHKTGRMCPNEDCDEELYDAIVHFGEMNRFDVPYRWETAETHAAQTDLIVCIGTSLKVLKAYKVLWPKKCKLVIINLQWTPKDKKADLLIRGQSDQILCEVAKAFDIPISPYSESEDPLISLATALNENDPKPSTPFLNMVENNAKFPVESNNFKTNFKEHYTPGWYGKGMKKN
ncbi:Oidioi.mRNA.OKI2018_I69.chr2.g8315.t1.cds [Oikopleura dioica]|uniref:Regulatory protein SIR2 homolog 7 n=1 Tax=Oikopleura dioica TaxID=34765 RepID=A0ABN7TF32_OIKDI|nr:Oidioi.mRNA.OKI2018_I69.chr2.g8315.t1.cds [Oikopleura dioica]